MLSVCTIQSESSTQVQELSGLTSLALLAHDRVGFGLTSRPKALDYYSRAFNARVALRLIDQLHCDPARRVVLVGHSLGASLSARTQRAVDKILYSDEHNVKNLALGLVLQPFSQGEIRS